MDKFSQDGGMSPADDLPDVPSALNRLMSTVKWIEGGRLVEFNNVTLAKACGDLLGAPISHSHIAKIRQATNPDPRGSVVWAITRTLSERSPVQITPDYFYMDNARAKVDRELDLHLEQLTTELARAAGKQSPRRRPS